ncbi:sialin-like isoform X2 [Artemia franciscana]|uniref:sialin-like isoform X2 n=1 Tax=Artemia franciscana TaxID=6661 RepID=UPI0032DA7BE1
MADQQKGPMIPARYIFTFFASAGLAILYGLKVNLSVAIVAMVNHTGLAETTHDDGSHGQANVTYACPAQGPSNSTNTSEQDGPFLWNEPTQGLILGAYFWGYILTQMLGGWLAEKHSAKWVFWTSVIVNAVLTLITPWAANVHFGLVIAVRFVEGLGAGISLPAMHVLLSKWAPPTEKGRISSFTYAGMSLGTVISLPFSGVLAGKLGWAWVFYIQGIMSLVWCVLWIFLVFDSPLTHKFINPVEKQFLIDSMNLKAVPADGVKKQKVPVPWLDVLKSMPFWAIAVAHTCGNWGWYMFLVELPTYMKQILRFDIAENASLSALPYLAMWVFSIILSSIMDKLRKDGIIDQTAARKICTGISSLLPAICLVAVSFSGCNRPAAVALMTVGVMFVSGMYCGHLTNHVDIAPNYAGTLMALTNTVATVPGFIVPIFVGELTHGNQSHERWQIIFWVTAVIYIVQLVFYTIFASGEEQPWNKKYTKDGDSVEAGEFLGH